jgi:hypothetical protein
MEMGPVYRAMLVFRDGNETKVVIYGPYKSKGTAKIQAVKYLKKTNGNLPYWFTHSNWELIRADIQMAVGWDAVLTLGHQDDML